MKKSGWTLILIILILAIMPIQASAIEFFSAFDGEQINYAIMKFGLKAGKATLVFNGLKTIKVFPYTSVQCTSSKLKTEN